MCDYSDAQAHALLLHYIVHLKSFVFVFVVVVFGFSFVVAFVLPDPIRPLYTDRQTDTHTHTHRLLHTHLSHLLLSGRNAVHA
jgi:hypothetical protein